MKKWFLILLAALLLLAAACKPTEDVPAQTPHNGTETPQSGSAAETPGPDVPDATMPPAPEDPDYEPISEGREPLSESVSGEWYADVAGLTVPLTLGEDGSYTLSLPGADPQTGTWEVKDGVLILDGDKENPVLPIGDVLRMEALDLLFTRERPTVYAPAEPYADAKVGSFDGYWKSYFTAMGDGTILSDAIGEDTELYIEGTNVALGGARFGKIIRTATVQDGALTIDENGTTVTIRLQTDGFLRMTIAGDNPAVLYLMPAVILGAVSEP